MEQEKGNVRANETQASEYKLSDFKFENFLNNNTGRKCVTLLGSFPLISETDKAVVILEKIAFTKDNFESKSEINSENENGNHLGQKETDQTNCKFFSHDTKYTTEFINNIYGSYMFYPSPDLNGVKATVIYPATEKHIEKYSARRKYLVKETAVIYKNVTEPYIESSKFSLEWVYNILEHKQEADRIIFEDEDKEIGFILIPDLKWDGSKETLYMLALPHKHGMKSLRDLNETHLPLLKNIRDSSYKAIKEKYDLDETQIRVHIHYQPSFYHLHVHFTILTNEAGGINCERSHLLDTVINNIELVSDYYQKSTLTFVGFEGNALLEKIMLEVGPKNNSAINATQDGDESLDGNQRKKLKLSEEA
ncbi:m7GpppX diphosphatase [Condylostylus longicornis]|uniref:m7GpppX diphosphatase n=1 Tax=Condylostylus longicornis TaxID=2530218 RepID=UPI00244DEE6C|nr:m7GpppX diphosphatase [Condylostylus longicornis]